MEEVCSACGLPKSLCVCKAIEREAQKITVFVERKKYGKLATIVEGITENPKDVLSKLKVKLACGGTFKQNRLELQGDHRSRIKQVLVSLGFDDKQIEVV